MTDQPEQFEPQNLTELHQMLTEQLARIRTEKRQTTSFKERRQLDVQIKEGTLLLRQCKRVLAEEASKATKQ